MKEKLFPFKSNMHMLERNISKSRKIMAVLLMAIHIVYPQVEIKHLEEMQRIKIEDDFRIHPYSGLSMFRGYFQREGKYLQNLLIYSIQKYIDRPSTTRMTQIQCIVRITIKCQNIKYTMAGKKK
ncbi:hypothetical protein NEIRO03_1774 [Nematocida sp. AWRm78]|nr:hypothetical protein NEIRO02_1652 [Nematocida sp. AWRm79]KAI5184646.1 hypothetical protein NEIRO03_1774 [Nematocida sp. AWRm78]